MHMFFVKCIFAQCTIIFNITNVKKIFNTTLDGWMKVSMLDDEDLVHVVYQKLCKGVDGADVGEGQLVVHGPRQVGTEHNRQVGGRHLVHVTSVVNQTEKLHQVF